MIFCITPMWYMIAKNADTKMMVGSTANAKTFSGLCGSPSGPKTSVEPSAACPSADVTAVLAARRIRWPIVHLITSTAKTNWSPSPQATVRQRMALRLVEKA